MGYGCHGVVTGIKELGVGVGGPFCGLRHRQWEAELVKSSPVVPVGNVGGVEGGGWCRWMKRVW